MAIAIVQSKDGFVPGASGTSVASGNLPSSVTAGNLLYVFIIADNASGTHNTPTDTLGHTYTQIGTTLSGTANRLSQWYVANCSGGTNSVTASFSTAGDLRGVFVIELSGCKPSNPLHAFARQESPGDSGADVVSTGLATVTTQPGIMVGVGYDAQGTIDNAGTGCTSIATGFLDTGNPKARAEYKNITSTGSYQLTWSDGSFNIHVSGAAVFLEAAAPVITLQPTNQTVANGGTALFDTTVVDADSYQWEYVTPTATTWANVSGGSGGTTADYTTPTLNKATDAGSMWRLRAYNATGNTFSTAVAVFITEQLSSYSGIGLIVGASDSFVGYGMVGGPTSIAGGYVNIKTFNGLSIESVKQLNGLVLSSIKAFNGTPL